MDLFDRLMMRKLSDPLVISNIIYLFVWIIWLYLVWYYAIPNLVVGFVSALYHQSKEVKFATRDTVFAYLSIATNCILLSQDYTDLLTLSWSLILILGAPGISVFQICN